jgi:hypothetical protein
MSSYADVCFPKIEKIRKYGKIFISFNGSTWVLTNLEFNAGFEYADLP